MIDEISRSEPGRRGSPMAMQAEDGLVAKRTAPSIESTVVNAGPSALTDDLEVSCVPAESRFPD